MKQLLEFIPLILFFVVYKMSGIQMASIALVIATIVQMIALKMLYGKIEKQQIIMGGSVVFFGLLSAYFNEVKYLQWKVNHCLRSVCIGAISEPICVQNTINQKIIRQRNSVA